MNAIRGLRLEPRAARGFYLLEALVALIVFAIGMLGLLSLLAGALRASAGATWRSEGFDIAANALARIATEDAAAVSGLYDASANGSGYRALLAQAMGLPGVSADANAPEVTFEDATESRRVDVVVHWQAPGEAVHRASVRATLPHR